MELIEPSITNYIYINPSSWRGTIIKIVIGLLMPHCNRTKVHNPLLYLYYADTVMYCTFM